MRPTTFLSVAFAGAVTGCFYPVERGKMLEARIDRLESENRDLEVLLKKQKAELAAQMPRLDAQVEAVQKAMELLDRAARHTGADIGVQMEAVKTDLNGLRGSVETSQHRLAQLETQLAQIKDGQEKVEKERAAREEKAREEKEAREAKKKAETPPADKKAGAEFVVQKIADDPSLGRSLADDWLKKYPKDPLAARVYHAKGSSYLKEKDWRSALSEFGEIVKGFAKSEQAPDALLKSSECFAALKMNDEARLALETIVDSYPKSEAAKVAKTRLAELKRPTAKKK